MTKRLLWFYLFLFLVFKRRFANFFTLRTLRTNILFSTQHFSLCNIYRGNNRDGLEMWNVLFNFIVRTNISIPLTVFLFGENKEYHVSWNWNVKIILNQYSFDLRSLWDETKYLVSMKSHYFTTRRCKHFSFFEFREITQSRTWNCKSQSCKFCFNKI